MVWVPIPVLIPTGMTYSVTLEGHTPKVVRCEGCGLEYVYFLEGKAEGTGTSGLFQDRQRAQERAIEKAQISLREQLEKACAPVPCPTCGQVQRHMFDGARIGQRPGMLKAGTGLLILAGVLSIPGLILALLSLANDDGGEVAVGM